MRPLQTLRTAARRLRNRLQRPLVLHDIFSTRREPRALLCHLTYPFRRKDKLAHTQYRQAHLLAELLHARGFRVDVTDHDFAGHIPYGQYDLLLGFGSHLRTCFMHRMEKRPRVVLYSPGIHNHEQNLRTMKRVRDFHERHGAWLLESGRFVEEDWTSLALLADGVLVLGNEAAAETYRRRTDRPVYPVPNFFYPLLDPAALCASRSIADARHQVLWFGSTGLIHKGLDLALEAVTRTTDWHLHVCGPLHREPAFMNCVEPLLQHPRVHVHGFVNLASPDFANLLRQCAFTLSPTCSEGGSPATLNTVGNGGLIPLVSREAGLDIGPFGLEIPDLTAEGILSVLHAADALDNESIRAHTVQAYQWAQKHHTQETYVRHVEAALDALLARPGNK